MGTTERKEGSVDTKALGSVAVLKAAFDVPEKPLTNQELIAFRKEDKDGFDKLAAEAREYLEALP